MAYNFKEVMNKPERLAPGHRMCAGCGGTITVRNVLRALHEGDKAVIGNATGCLEVSTFMYPYTAYEDSYIHNLKMQVLPFQVLKLHITSLKRRAK